MDKKMEHKITITDENGNKQQYTINPNCGDKTKNLDNFILECLSISEDKRKLPLITLCPNNLEVYPSIKMKFENYGSPLLGNKLEAIMITWRD